MQRYFINEAAFKENKILGDDCFHIRKVMRNKLNDEVEVCYDAKCYLVRLTEITNDYVSYEIIKTLKEAKPLKNKITLIQGMPKGDKTEEIIMHSTELGVNEVILVEMIRSIAKIDLAKFSNKLTRYQKIAKEAAEQAHILRIPDISVYKNLFSLDYESYDLLLLLDEEEAKKEDPLLLKDLDLNKKNICFIVGPEGGIDPKERSFLIEKGFIPVSLGENILRTQTASLSFLAMLKYALM